MKNSLLRKLLIALAVLVLVIGSLLAWLVASFDAERAKALAIAWMQQHRDRTLVIGGPLKLSVYPRLQLRLTDVHLSERQSATEFVALDEASLSVALLPLLSKSLVVDRISARGLRLNYTRNAKGASNIDDLLAADAEPDKSGSTELRMDVSQVEFADLRARVRDELAHVNGEIVLVSFSSGRLASGTESPLALEAQFALQEPAVSGNLSGQTRLTLDLPGHTASLRDMALKFKGNAMGINGIDAGLRGALAWNGAEGTLQAEDLSLKGSATLGKLKLTDSSLELQRFGFDPEHQNLSLAKLALRLDGSSAGNPLKLVLDWPQLDVKGKTLQGSAFQGSLVLEGDTGLSGSFKSDAPRGNFDAVTLPGFEASFKGTSGPRKLSGTFKSDLQLHPTDKSLALDKMAVAAQLQDPGLQAIALGLHGTATLSAQKTRWALNGQLNGSDFSTSGNAAFADDTPMVQAQARFGVLDLNALLPPAPKVAQVPPQGSAEAPIDLNPLRSLNGRFDLRAASLAYRTYRVSDAALGATLEGGALRVSELRGKTWGGSLDGSAFADARANRIGVKAKVDGVNVNALLKDVAGKDILEGTGRVTLDVETLGRSVSEMKSRLKGTAALQLRDGAVKGINLAKSLRQVKSALGGKQDSTVKSDQTEKTDFSEMSASFVISDGVARNSDLDVKSPFLRVGGDGAIDIAKARIDYTMRANVVGSAQGQGSGDLEMLKGVTVPVRLTGALEAMEWKIQWSSVAAGVAKGQLKQKLVEKLGLPGADKSEPSANPKQQLKQKLLKGLFK